MNPLLLMRHGEALVGGLDTARPLSPRGLRQAQDQAHSIQARLRLDWIIASPSLRAQETAAVVQQVFSCPLSTHAALVPEARLSELYDLLLAIPDGIGLLVGHNPLLTRFVSDFTGRQDIGFDTASCVAVTFDYPAANLASLGWQIHPAI